MPKNTNIILIRHAEKPSVAKDPSLAVAGQERAQAYVVYFQNYPNSAAPLKWNYMFATAVSPDSNRPLLTIQPLSQALGLTINNSYADKDFKKVADDIKTNPEYDNSNILICWHHGRILQLAHHLGAPKDKLPAKWAGAAFGWLIKLSFDSKGNLQKPSVINQNLMFDDNGNDPPVMVKIK